HYPRTAAPLPELTIPTAEIASHAVEPLSATGITKATHAANHRILECRGVVPSVTALLAWRALERLAKSDAGVSDGNNDDAPTEPLRPAIRLHHHPAATPCMPDGALADLAAG